MLSQDRLTRLFHYIASLAIVVMMLTVVSDVVLRFAFNTPVQGAYDVVGFSLLIMVFFGMAPVVAKRSEIVIDLIDTFLPARSLGFLKWIASFGTLVFFVFLGWSMFGPARDAYTYGDRSLELGVPQWTLWAIAFVGLAGNIWVALRRLFVRDRDQADTPSISETKP
ncbi:MULTISPECIES: TRAP transporter small permease [Pacificibacter]|uniref:TRAP transporter small permease n=1 Tax=Pacificibacter TaxID=1042323 RepID=UPI001C09AF7E|nr:MULTISPECIES: TRAP transporter small permease [Pacificibacter]MBU2937386.1 TRAP transporter small permease [Pacificibacter marinus]MDO6617315.1 TRAP transporter small permease [Pacificibacter sp. 1_MG-2023]